MPPRPHASRGNRRMPPRGGARRAANANRGLRTVNAQAGSGSWFSPSSSFPDRAKTSLLYVDVGRVNPGVLTERDTLWHLNSVFDPYVTGAGHQPREFDTWATLYNKYRVFAVRYELWLRQRAAHGIRAVVVPNNSNVALTTGDYPSELPRSEVLGMTGSSQPIIHARGSFACHAILGQTAAQYAANENTAALVTTDPGELLYLHLFISQLDAATVLDVEYELRLSYEVEFFDRKVVGPSALARQLLESRAGPAWHPSSTDDDDLVDPRDADPRSGGAASAAGGPCPGSAFPPLATSRQVQLAAAKASRTLDQRRSGGGGRGSD